MNAEKAHKLARDRKDISNTAVVEEKLCTILEQVNHAAMNGEFKLINVDGGDYDAGYLNLSWE